MSTRGEMGVRRRRRSSASSEESLLINVVDKEHRAPRVAYAKRKKSDGPFIAIFQLVAITVSLGAFYFCWFYFDHFHYYLTHFYASKMDDKHAQHTMGHKLLKDQINTSGAFHWFRMSANNGHPHSAYNLAAGHLSGYKTDVKKGEVKTLLEYAAQNGVKEAQVLLRELCADKPKHCLH